jgi:YihY family inner membrane protein
MTTVGTTSPVRSRIPEPVPRPAGVAGGAIRRFRDADGGSHTRALAFQTMFVAISGFIGFIGLVSVLHLPAVRDTMTGLAQRLAPGPSGKLLAEAARQGATRGGTAMFLGLLSALVAGTLAMMQIERSANRLFGLREDRPTGARIGRAFALTVSAGILLAIAGLVLGAGQSIGHGAGWHGTSGTVWSVLRWPLGIVIGAAGTFLLFRWAPRERVGSRRAEVTGAVVASALWVVFTAALGLSLSMSSSSTTYGPLLAIVALLLWSALAALALHLGLAVTAEMGGARGEPVRATAGHAAS